MSKINLYRVPFLYIFCVGIAFGIIFMFFPEWFIRIILKAEPVGSFLLSYMISMLALCALFYGFFAWALSLIENSRIQKIALLVSTGTWLCWFAFTWYWRFLYTPIGITVDITVEILGTVLHLWSLIKLKG